MGALAQGLPLNASPITPPPILSVLALWPRCHSWTALVLLVLSQDLSLEHPLPRYVHSSLLTPRRCSRPRHLLRPHCPPSLTCYRFPTFFLFLELITMQLPVCCTCLSFYLPGYFPLLKCKLHKVRLLAYFYHQ